MEMDLQTEKYQTVEEDTQVVEAEPDNNEDSPEEERTYSQAEVEEIIREHLLRFQSLPVQETQQTTELTYEKKFYLGQKIRKYADRFGHQGIISNTPVANPIGGYAEDVAERLYGFLDATNLESFTAAVDAVFALIEFSEEQGYKTGYSRCRSDYEEKAQKQEPKEEFNIVSEIFRTGGR